MTIVASPWANDSRPSLDPVVAEGEEGSRRDLDAALLAPGERRSPAGAERRRDVARRAAVVDDLAHALAVARREAKPLGRLERACAVPNGHSVQIAPCGHVVPPAQED
jgi:hypothetical protein